MEAGANVAAIQVFDDLIAPDAIEAVRNLTQRRGYLYGWHSNKNVVFSHWNTNFSRTGQNSRNRLDIRAELPSTVIKIWESFQPKVLPENPVLVRAYCNAYTYGCDGYIHSDSDVTEDITAIMYLNKQWNPNWAGETAFFDDSGEIVRSVIPKYGRLVTFPSRMRHVGRAVSRICPQLRTVLVFKARPEGEVVPIVEVAPDKQRELLRKTLSNIGANQIQHSGRTLLDHLVGTYDLLKKWGCKPQVCLAGGLHSIYGTNAFKKVTVGAQHRPAVSKRFGEAAEKLAWLFCSLNRPKALDEAALIDRRTGTPLIISDEELQVLRLIEAANLLEQGSSLDRWPNIKAAIQRQIVRLEPARSM